ncbi:MAG: hypothetical protein IEMM0002_0691 [bacterium]|nr:MAG: hypothetical protein IEMM0002_0691 [bacterium]
MSTEDGKTCGKLQGVLGACNQKNPPLLKGRWRGAPEGLEKTGKTTPSVPLLLNEGGENETIKIGNAEFPRGEAA